MSMYNRRFTPENITHLAEKEVFVFGSNLQGMHGGVEAIRPYVDQFVAFAAANKDYTFFCNPHWLWHCCFWRE